MDYPTYNPPHLPKYPVGRQEIIFGVITVILSIGLWNSILFGGFNLGFSIFSGLSILCAVAYLLISGCRFSLYSGSLLGLSLVICAGFARTDDGFVKFVMFCFLLSSYFLLFPLTPHLRVPLPLRRLLVDSKALPMAPRPSIL